MTKQVPVHLRPFISKQHYEQYSPIDHAVWRFVMKLNHYFLKKIAHEKYVNGLRDSGIQTEAIPKVDDMNSSLAKVGWGAVSIDGLIPGSAFYSFLANGLLPIATEIRNIQNIAYTPAPDMIHEAAGHAPILLDESYREFVQKIGEMGSKAISTKEKLEVFMAVRHLTIVAEDPKSTPEQVKEAERAVAEARSKVKGLSESDMVSRLFWWTVEYGLIGDLGQPKIYGAGLLSSVGESQSCLAPDVRKIPFSVEACIQTPYDVTKPQPQLFVCASFEELAAAVDEFAATMAFKKGGTESLDKALKSDNTATMVFSSGLQVTGTIDSILKDENGEAVYFRTKGPTALSFGGTQLAGHGTETHRKGFGTPIGMLHGGVVLEDCSRDELREMGIFEENQAVLIFESGVRVEGVVQEVLCGDENPILISFKDCTVTYKDLILFEPSWGVFDMPVGKRITSVFAGAADPDAYFSMEELPVAPEQAAEHREWSELESWYSEIRTVRESGQNFTELDGILSLLDRRYPDEWLLRLEILELYKQNDERNPNIAHIEKMLKSTDWEPAVQQMIERGLIVIENS